MLVAGVWYFPLLLAALGVYWNLPSGPRVRLSFLLATSCAVLTYLLWRQLSNGLVLSMLAVFAFISVVTYLIARHLQRQRSRGWLWVAVTQPFLAYVPLQCGTFGWCERSGALPWLVPVSVGFFALRQVHFAYECYRGSIKQHSFLEFAAYVAFFPTLIAGPIERYRAFSAQIGTKFGWDHMSLGAERLVIGAFKKFVVADLLLRSLLPPDELTRSGFEGVSWRVAMVASAAKFLFVYFEFSGYSDMAIGTARLFGIRILENFNYPLLRSNLAEFWCAWHMSLASLARDYVYFPILVSTRNTVLALLATMLVIAAWHGISAGWLLWGLHHGIGLAVLAGLQRRMGAWEWLAPLRSTLFWRIGSTMATLQFVVIGYALTWHPEDVMLSLKIYAKLWTLGVLT